MNRMNEVELSIAELPGKQRGETKVSVNGVEIGWLLSIDVSASREALTEVTLKFYANVNQPKADG